MAIKSFIFFKIIPVQISSGHLDILRTIHDCKEIAAIESQRLNNMVCMFHF